MKKNSQNSSPIDLLYEDDALLVLNKRPGIIVIPDQHTDPAHTLLGALTARQGQKVYVVHRLDRDTTGVIVFAKNAEAHRHLSMQFEHGEVRKAYLALVNGRLLADEGCIDAPIHIDGRDVSIDSGGKESLTRYRVLERFKDFTLVEALPETGRRHQIRIHFWSLGHPLAVDPEHGHRKELFLSEFKRHYKSSGKEFPVIARLTLHAGRLELKDPRSGAPRVFTAPLPKDLDVTLKLLRKYNTL